MLKWFIYLKKFIRTFCFCINGDEVCAVDIAPQGIRQSDLIDWLFCLYTAWMVRSLLIANQHSPTQNLSIAVYEGEFRYYDLDLFNLRNRTIKHVGLKNAYIWGKLFINITIYCMLEKTPERNCVPYKTTSNNER